MTWITTFTGKKFDLLSPTEDMLCLEDIAHSLSMQCRYNGHTKTFYSVAQHCCLMVEQGRRLGWPEGVLKYVLFHDAAEAYTGDLPRPLKFILDYQFERIEEDIEEVIFSKYLELGFDSDKVFAVFKSDVKVLDDQFLCLEAYHLMSNWQHVWRAFDKEFLKTVNELSEHVTTINCWNSDQAEENFLEECKQLGIKD